MTGSPARLLQYLRRLASQQPSASDTDAVLLGRFVRHRDEDAFAALVARQVPVEAARGCLFLPDFAQGWLPCEGTQPQKWGPPSCVSQRQNRNSERRPALRAVLEAASVGPAPDGRTPARYCLP